ncbi:MAG: ATP-dependent DNA helicase [Armatimonadota bacterium]|nr:ATP-dependent DNA helicase [Armatimonadota bacterium]MDR5698026.1 ATP-dependent DNA helicase [Armatimonadota bacterium]
MKQHAPNRSATGTAARAVRASLQIALTLDTAPQVPTSPIERVVDGLNDEQRRAVAWDSGPLLIIAGAGTGKTAVITRRIAYLITSKRARPSEILALTFTDKAAAEMEERVDVLVPYGYTDIWISTFHAFGERVLRDNALVLGLPPDFRVLDRAEQVLFLRENLFELPLRIYRPLGDPTRHLQALVSLFSRAKDEAVSPSDYLQYAEAVAAQATQNPGDEEMQREADRQMELAQAYAAYQRLLGERGLVDFGDLITLTLRLFRDHPAALRPYQERFRYILVDEFQDTNHAQFEIVKLLAARHRNVTVVGDDDQAIYKWRGAAISNILDFARTYPDAHKIVLLRNYRSGQAILDAAYRLIRHNDPDRLEVREDVDKRLIADRPQGPLPEHLHFDTLSTEADAVAARIADRVEAGEWHYRDVAILVRANNDAEPFLRALNMRGIPFQFSGSRGLYDREEIRLVLAFLRVLADPQDSLSLYYLGTSPLYAVGATDMARCLATARQKNRSLEWVFRNLDAQDLSAEVSPESRAAIEKMLADLEAMRERSAAHPTGRVLYEYLVERTGYVKRLASSGNPNDEMRVRNLARLFDIVARTAPLLRYDRAVEFLRHIDERIQAGDDPAVAEADPDADAVQVLTVHKAKGLEFPVVFVVSCVDRRFPLGRRADPIELPDTLIRDVLPEGDHHLQEERRLFYVAMTRARRELYLTSARDYGGLRPRKVSRFVLEALDVPAGSQQPFRASAAEQIHRHAPPAGEPLALEGIVPSDGVVSVSFRQLDDYQTCPLKFKYAHILRVPVTRDHRVAYGFAIHEAVREYNRRRARRQAITLDELIAYFEKVWVNEGFISREHEERRMAEGRAVLAAFYEHQASAGTVPTMVEAPFSFVRGNTRVRGRWDRVDVRDGEVCVVDFKTSDVREPDRADERVRDSLQLRLYAMAYNEVYGKLPDRLEMHFLGPGGVVVGSLAPEPSWVADAADAIDRVADGIRRGDFVATPDWFRACRHCAFSAICPYTAKGD